MATQIKALLCACFLLASAFVFSQNSSIATNVNNVDALKDTLQAIANRNSDNLLARSCESIIRVIDAEEALSDTEISFLNEIYEVFAFDDGDGTPRSFESYLLRQRSLVIAWQSPTDNEISYAMVKLPKNWSPDKEYPMYVQLHGYWDVAGNAINYMTYSYRHGPSSTYAFEDGYRISPRGRGNLWYEGISETDIWECIQVIEDLFDIQEDRRYLCGHSMGGYGAMNLGQKTAEMWAAIGIHAGALWWGNEHLVSDAVIENLKNTPVYFVCGDSDQLLSVNQEVYSMLENQGNTEIEFVTFEGGHDYRSEDVERMYDWMSDFVLSYNEEEIADLYNIKAGPNPVHGQLKIRYHLQSKSSVEIKLVDTSGKLLKIIKSKGIETGSHEILWYPFGISPGIYFCQININEQLVSKKICFN